MIAAVVPETPPTGFPPVIVSEVFDDQADGPWSTGVVSAGRLIVESRVPGAVCGVAAHGRPLRDVILDASLALKEGGSDDLIGLYLRQSDGERYLACGVSSVGRVGMFSVDGADRRAMVEGDLPPDLPFNPGIGQRNRITVLACGPSLTMLLNGAVVAGVTVDARFKQGHAGLILIKGSAEPASRAEVDWLQVRAVLADQAVIAASLP